MVGVCHMRMRPTLLFIKSRTRGARSRPNTLLLGSTCWSKGQRVLEQGPAHGNWHGPCIAEQQHGGGLASQVQREREDACLLL